MAGCAGIPAGRRTTLTGRVGITPLGRLAGAVVDRPGVAGSTAGRVVRPPVAVPALGSTVAVAAIRSAIALPAGGPPVAVPPPSAVTTWRGEYLGGQRG